MLWVAVALAGSMALFMPGLLEQFETPKIELVRACGLGALACGLIAGRAGRPAAWGPLDRAVAAWLAVEILATVLSVSPRVSVVGETRQREGLLTSLALAGLYFAARDAFARPGRARLALDLALGLATAVGLYAVLQAAGQDPLQWQRQAVYEGGYVRPFATLGHPNLLGVVSAALASLALALTIGGGGGRARPLRGGAALLLTTVTVLTLSRAAWLGLAAGAAVAVALALRERGAARLSPRALGLAAAALVAAAAIVMMTGARELLARRVAELFAVEGGSGGSRLEIWRAALAAWRDRPLAGQGPDLFEMVFPRFQTPAYWRLEWSGLPFHAHSIYLHALATRGAIGLLAGGACVAGLAAAVVTAWRRAAAHAQPGLVPAAAALIVTCAVAGAFGALGIAGALLVVVAAAVVGGAAEAAPAPGAARRPGQGGARGRPAAAGRKDGARRLRPGGRQWAAWLAATAVTLATLLWGFTELRASRAASAARAFMTRAPERATRASGYAVTLAAHDDRLWRMHAQTLLWLTTVPGAPATALAEAETAARRAVALAPRRAENRLILARALATREAQGDTTARAAAAEAFHQSLALAPYDGLTLMEYADHEGLLGRPATALEAARRAVGLYPDEGQAWAALGRAWLAAGAPDSARTALERSLREAWRDEGRREAVARELDRLRGAPPAGL
jgi:O-antigen ligase